MQNSTQKRNYMEMFNAENSRKRDTWITFNMREVKYWHELDRFKWLFRLKRVFLPL